MLSRIGKQVFVTSLFVTLVLGTNALAQTPKDSATDQKAGDQASVTDPQKSGQQDQDPLKRKMTEQQRKKNEKALKVELSGTYKKWLDEDVRWIITPEERATFKKLSNDEERDQFIEQFWLRRDPTPDTVENEYKEEHYRRIAYANEHFASGVPGWRTDRGRIYIMYGPPDEIDSHPSGGMYERPQDEGGGETSTYPFEDWRYRYLDNLPGTQKQEVIIEFVDTCMCNDYHMTMDRSEKDALLNVPGAGLTQWEAMGMANKSDRFAGGGLERLGVGPMSSQLQTQEFDRLEQFANLQQAPQIKFKDLAELVTTKISVNLLPFEVQTDFVKVTSDTVLVPVTIQVKDKDVTFVTKEGVSRGTLNIFGRVTTLTGKIAQTFEEPVQIDMPSELVASAAEKSALYWKALPLKPGLYRLDVVVKDVNGDRVGTWSHSLRVPAYDEDKLASSSLIVADQMEKVPTSNVGTGNFVIGTTKVRPRVGTADGKPAVFKRDQKANFWIQVYNLTMDQTSKKPSANIEYDIVNVANKKAIVHMSESTAQLGNVGDQITLEKSLPLASLEPGLYQITIKVNDNVSKQEIAPSAQFSVE
jgi:GWxTD domain-containing protein